METRIEAVKMTKVLLSGHTFKSMKEFPPGVLPTNREVICRVLNEEKFLQYEAAHTVAEKLVQLCICCNVYTISTARVGSKIQQLMKEFSNLDRYLKTKRGTTFLQKEATFMEKRESLFDIFCEIALKEDI